MCLPAVEHFGADFVDRMLLPRMAARTSVATGGPGQPVRCTWVFYQSVGPLDPFWVDPLRNVSVPVCAPPVNQHPRLCLITRGEIIEGARTPSPRVPGVSLVHGLSSPQKDMEKRSQQRPFPIMERSTLYWSGPWMGLCDRLLPLDREISGGMENCIPARMCH